MRSDRYAVSPAQVELTWDETDHDRITTLSKNFNKDELLNMDFQAYLASSSEDEEDEVEAEGERSRSRPSYLNNHHTVKRGGKKTPKQNSCSSIVKPKLCLPQFGVRLRKWAWPKSW